MQTSESYGKFILVSPSATPFSYGGNDNIISRKLYLSAAGDVTCLNDIGETIVIPFLQGQILPVATSTVTTVSAGTCVAFFE